MIANLIAWVLALIAMSVCEIEANKTCPAPPPTAASSDAGSDGSRMVANPKIINEI
jgi:hypothetical protein